MLIEILLKLKFFSTKTATVGMEATQRFVQFLVQKITV